MTTTMRRSAIISPCGLYRYRLERVISDGPTMMFLMVNPSDADDEIDDPTVRKCIGFAKRNHYGRVLIGNKFAFRSPDIRALRSARDPIGPDNDAHLRGMFAEANVVVAGWGSLNKIPEALQTRWRDMVRMAARAGEPLYCLGTNADRHPRHPLMLGYDTPLEPWKAPWFAGRKKPAPTATQRGAVATALLLITSLSPRSPQAQSASLKADDSHSGQPHNEGGGTKSVGEAQ